MAAVDGTPVSSHAKTPFMSMSGLVADKALCRKSKSTSQTKPKIEIS